MRYIHKEIKNEPKSLKKHRDTEGATYQSISGLKESLLNEQGFLCAYCMRSISFEHGKTGIEHILSQESHPNKKLDYHNLVAVCNGSYGQNPHCDKTKEYNWQGKTCAGKINGKTELTKLYPTNINCERLITYNSNGSIKPLKEDPQVEEDLLKLNLNDEKYKAFRKNKIDATLDRLKKNKAIRDWTKKDFDKEIEFWESKTEKNYEDFKYMQHREFFSVCVWFLKTTATKPQYKR